MKMKNAACVLLLLGVAVFCMGSGGGEYRPLAAVFRDGGITDVVVVSVQGYEIQKCRRVTLYKDNPDADKSRGEISFGEFTYTKLVLDFEVTDAIAGELKKNSPHSLSYVEPSTSYEFHQLPNGDIREGLHVTGFIYTGSGKEFKSEICGIRKKVVLLLGEDRKKELQILRAEPFSDKLVAGIRDLLKEKKARKDADK